MNKQKQIKHLTFLAISFLILSLSLLGCKKTTYNVTFYFDDVIYQLEEVKKGEKVTIPNPPSKEGYDFAEWQINGEKFDESTKIKSDLEIRAKFEKKECQVTFIVEENSYKNGELVDLSRKYTRVVKYGELLEESYIGVSDAYQFKGWFIDKMDGELFSFDTPITSSIKLVGKIVQKKCQITFKTNCEEIIPTQTVEYNELAKEPSALQNKGHHFLGWYLNDELYDFNKKVTKDIILEARWEKDTYIVNFNTNTEDTIQSQIVKYQEQVIMPDLIYKDGAIFDGWYLNGELYDFTTSITQNITLEAKWSVKTFIVRFNTNDGSKIPNQKVEYLDFAKQPSNPFKEGYMFMGWYLNDELFDFTTPIINDLTLVAKWEPRKYRIRFDTNFELDIDDQMVYFGEKIIIKEELVRPGYEFIGWYEHGKRFDLNTPIGEPHSLIAKWDISKELLTELLASSIAKITEEELYLPTTLNDLNGTITWQSSNEEVVNSSGKVKRLTYDVNVVLKAIIEKENETFELEFKTMVKKIDLKPLINGKIVSGYLYFGGGVTPLSEKAISQLDLINYSFGEIKDGKVYLPYPDAAKEVLKYRQSGVRVVLAIGGWGAGGFSEAMISAETRTKLIGSIMDILKEYQFDGIDIDWEYPTSSVAGISSNPNDKNNLTLFCQEMKEKMRLYRDDLLLSIAVTPSDTFYDFRKLNEYVDIFNVMTYDFAMGNNANHDSPLYSSSYGSSSIDKAVNFMKSRVDANKIIPGAAFYCRNGKFSDHQTLGARLSTSMAVGAISFKKLKEMMLKDTSFVENYDVTAGAAYAIYNGNFYSYDNERSIKEKCEYVKNNQLGGLMCWDLSQDYVANDGTSLLINAMYVTLKKEN